LAQNVPPLDDLCNLIDPPNNDVEDTLVMLPTSTDCAGYANSMIHHT
jgi:hypothetical protein